MAILGISTNTRLLGLAVITQNGLAEYSIRLHKSSWSQSKATMILAGLEPCVRRYCIKRIVLSMPYEYHQTEAFRYLAKRIATFSKANNIPFFTEPPEAFHPLFSPGEKKTKKNLMRALCLDFPQLSLCYQKEQRNKNKYYIKLFEAVGVAALHDERD